MGDLLLDLGAEFVGCAFEFVKIFANQAGDLRQLLGPEDDEGQKEQEDSLAKTHSIIILPEAECGNPRDRMLTLLADGLAEALAFAVKTASYHGLAGLCRRSLSVGPPLHHNLCKAVRSLIACCPLSLR